MTDITPWAADWLWGLPIIMVTVLIHALGLFAVRNLIFLLAHWQVDTGRSFLRFSFIVVLTVLALSALHGFEAGIWALVYLLVGAMTDFGSATLYSLEAMTTYGHASLSLAPHWRMMGALEALNGLMLFGLTTAFLFAVLQPVLQVRGQPNARTLSRRHRHDDAQDR